MSVQALPTGLPATGTWTVDPRHSSVIFAVKHHAVCTYRAAIGEFEGSYDAATRTLTGSANPASVQTFEMLRDELAGPNFFDATQHPTISFRSTSIEEREGAVTIEGDLTLKGVTKRITAAGAVTPTSTVARFDGAVNDHFGIELETTFDRRDFGVDFNNELVAGGLNLSWDVELLLSLELAAPHDS